MGPTPGDAGANGIFSPAVRRWFTGAFEAPTRAQNLGWPAIAAGDHTLLLAPTGSGKTLAAFLWAIDQIVHDPIPPAPERCRVLYLSPLKALAVDVERNLRTPLVGIRRESERAAGDHSAVHLPTVGIRTGDTPSDERRRMQRSPPDILVTTPESLYLMLTSRAREMLRSVRWVIVDEIHSVAATKRGSHLSLSLERLEELTPSSPQRIGLSATQRPLDEIARFLGGFDGETHQPRPVTVVDASGDKVLDIEVIVPVDDMANLPQLAPVEQPSGPEGVAPGTPAPSERDQKGGSIWPFVHPKLLDLIEEHRSTLIFVNARRLAERLAARLNELWRERTGMESGPDLVLAHHGSLSRERRLLIEDALKRGELRALVATSSLELGIDMGAVDLVVQVESPGSVARGLQRIGRAGHQVGEPSVGKIFPKYRGDLLEAAVTVPRMRAGLVEETRYPRNPLDVLAQQIVAACALDEWDVDALRAMVRRSASFAELPDDAFTAVLDLLSGRYPSDEFSGLRPRIVWDRVGGRVRAREGAARVAIVNGGTIPDRGLFGVFLPDGTRVGELDEEMVYESRSGDTFVLGASAWRIEEVTRDRVVVTPAPGEFARVPFWKGDKPGRPLELGRALGAATRELHAATPAVANERLRGEFGLDERAASNLLGYLAEQAEATGVLPDDRTVVVERFPDEIGDWRVCVLTPFGARVHAPWALALEARLGERLGSPLEVMWSDDGIVMRLPEAYESIPVDDLLLDPDEVEDLVVEQLPATGLFAARFREASARALLLPRRRPGERTPLWQQRQRAADLLEVASRYPSFPMILEATRECLRDVFDLPALREVLTDLRSRAIRLATVDTRHASPFAQSLLFGWIAVYMYEGDAPLAERRAAALSLDRELLRELLGTDELRELLDPDVVGTVELELQRLAPDSFRVRHADDLHDLLRELGDLTVSEIAARTAALPADAEARASALVDELVAEHRALRVSVAGDTRWAAAEDAARYRDALGAAIPRGLPDVFGEPVADPLFDLLARTARTHGPFTTTEVATRFGLPPGEVHDALQRLEDAGRIAAGEFRPGGTTREWCDLDVLRRLRRRTLATLRREIEPVEPDVLARFLAAWHGIGAGRRGKDALVESLGQLQGAATPASVLESEILPARVDGYRPAMLDELCASGELCWAGAGSIGASDGRIVLAFRDRASALLLEGGTGSEQPDSDLHDRLRAHLAGAGASFWPDLLAAAADDDGHAPDDTTVLAALWDLVWSGEVTNDSLAALRSHLASRPRSQGGRPRPGRLSRLGPPAAAGRWSLVAALRRPPPAPTETLAARAEQLLERHGVLTREAVRAEGVSSGFGGGFAAVYPHLRALEETGRVRRGYFVAGLGAAQFALPGATDRLRGERDSDTDDAVVLAATDPAQPYGAAIAWPELAGRPSRSPGARCVLRGGHLLAYVERGGHGLLTNGDDHPAWVEALAALVKDGRVRRVDLRTVDGLPARTAPAAEALREAGFVDGYRGLVLSG
jgi:ATP-dependent Lhr-like helicase